MNLLTMIYLLFEVPEVAAIAIFVTIVLSLVLKSITDASKIGLAIVLLYAIFEMLPTL